MKQRIGAAIERWAVRHRILATEEASAYYSWADERLDQLARIAAYRERHQAHPLPGADPEFDALMREVTGA